MRGDLGLGGEIAEWFGFGRSNGCSGIHAEVPLELDLKLCKTWYWQVRDFYIPQSPFYSLSELSERCVLPST